MFLTGHTGFKGAWMATWLHQLGAHVHGFSLAPPPRGAFHDLGVAGFAQTCEADVRDLDAVRTELVAAAPDVVIHLAAQPLVLTSWEDPATTFGVNVMGTVNVVEAALTTPSVRGVLVATTDKVYANDGQAAPFVETDRLGGHDPYSASKAAAELALVPYRRAALMGLRDVPVVSLRAGNVIGGGDWAPGRLFPDLARAVERGTRLVVRRPDALRPWQHVLDCVSGYLCVADAILHDRPVADAYNFAPTGPPATVATVVAEALAVWGLPADTMEIVRESDSREAAALALDAGRAARELAWQPSWTLHDAIAATVRCYQDPSIAAEQIRQYTAAMVNRDGSVQPSGRDPIRHGE